MYVYYLSKIKTKIKLKYQKKNKKRSLMTHQETTGEPIRRSRIVAGGAKRRQIGVLRSIGLAELGVVAQVALSQILLYI